jgi:hypothetical protein
LTKAPLEIAGLFAEGLLEAIKEGFPSEIIAGLKADQLYEGPENDLPAMAVCWNNRFTEANTLADAFIKPLLVRATFSWFCLVALCAKNPEWLSLRREMGFTLVALVRQACEAVREQKLLEVASRPVN